MRVEPLAGSGAGGGLVGLARVGGLRLELGVEHLQPQKLLCQGVPELVAQCAQLLEDERFPANREQWCCRLDVAVASASGGSASARSAARSSSTARAQASTPSGRRPRGAG